MESQRQSCRKPTVGIWRSMAGVACPGFGIAIVSCFSTFWAARRHEGRNQHFHVSIANLVVTMLECALASDKGPHKHTGSRHAAPTPKKKQRTQERGEREHGRNSRMHLPYRSILAFLPPKCLLSMDVFIPSLFSRAGKSVQAGIHKSRHR